MINKGRVVFKYQEQPWDQRSIRGQKRRLTLHDSVPQLPSFSKNVFKQDYGVR